MTDEADNTTTDTETTAAPAADAPATEETAPSPAEGAEAAPEAGAEGATPEPTAEQTEEKHRRAGGWQRRIEKLEREKEALLQRLLAQQGQPQQPGAAPAEEAPEDKAAAYIESLVAKKLAEKEAAHKQALAQADFQRRTQEVRAANPDFDEVLAGVSDIPIPQALQSALLTSPVGPNLMYELASNPAELARISALPPFEVAREIGRLEAMRASVSATPKATPKAAPRKPAAPAPIAPVAARGPTTVKPVEQMSYEEYSAWRDSQRKR